jgi:hypothetical protein
VADDLDDLDGAECDPQPPQGRELVIVDLRHATIMPPPEQDQRQEDEHDDGGGDQGAETGVAVVAVVSGLPLLRYQAAQRRMVATMAMVATVARAARAKRRRRARRRRACHSHSRCW